MFPVAKKDKTLTSTIPYLLLSVTMMYGSRDVKMGEIENQIFSVDRATSSGLKLTPIINHLEVKK